MTAEKTIDGDMKMQEPKYKFEQGQVINRFSGEAIPKNEPVMIFRARDIHAIQMLYYYRELVNDQEHADIVLRRIEQFEAFKKEFPDRMKEPDTELPEKSQ